MGNTKRLSAHDGSKYTTIPKARCAQSMYCTASYCAYRTSECSPKICAPTRERDTTEKIPPKGTRHTSKQNENKHINTRVRAVQKNTKVYSNHAVVLRRTEPNGGTRRAAKRVLLPVVVARNAACVNRHAPSARRVKAHEQQTAHGDAIKSARSIPLKHPSRQRKLPRVRKVALKHGKHSPRSTQKPPNRTGTYIDALPPLRPAKSRGNDTALQRRHLTLSTPTSSYFVDTLAPKSQTHQARVVLLSCSGLVSHAYRR